SFDDAAQKVMSSLTTHSEGVPVGVGGDVHPAPDAVTMLAVSGSLLGAVSVKAAYHGAARLTDAVRARVGGVHSDRAGDVHPGSGPVVVEGLRSDGGDDAADVRLVDDVDASGRVVLSSSMTRAQVDDALGVVDESNVSGQQCGDQAVA
ncbi:hypothetical protein ACPXB3_22525, partial [Gordonia sp. DT219]